MRGGAAVAFAPRALRPRGVAKAATPQPPSEPAQPTKKRRTAVSGSAKSGAAKSAPKIASAPELASASTDAPSWFERYAGSMSAEYKHYMQTEWGFPKRGDRPLFEKLSLEGAQAGLSWATILAKREAYRRAFHGFDLERCAAMTDAEIERLLTDGTTGRDAIVKNRAKVVSVRTNARAILRLIADAEGPTPPHGHFDAFLWSFVGGTPVINAWPSFADIPSESEVGNAMAKALKAKGFAFVGPKCCYSLMQSCGLVVDHPAGTPEHAAALKRSG